MKPEEVEENLNIEDFAALEQGNVKALFDTYRVDQDFDIELADESDDFEQLPDDSQVTDIPEAPIPQAPPMDVELDKNISQPEEPDADQDFQPLEPLPEPASPQPPLPEPETTPQPPSAAQGGKVDRPEPQFGPLADQQQSDFKPLDVFEEDDLPRPAIEASEEKEKTLFSGLKKKVKDTLDTDREPEADSNETELVKPYLDPELEENTYLEGEQESFLDSLKSKWQMYRNKVKVEEETEQQIGIDITPPRRSLSERITMSSSNSVNRSDFEQLLTPLSGTDLTILRSEISQDETIFSTIQSAKNRALIHHYMGIIFGIVMLVVFVAGVGKEYFIEILPNLAIPNWMPDTISAEIAGAGLYVIGILVPVFTIFIFAYGVRELLSMIEAVRYSQFRVDDLLLTIAAAICGFGALFACADANVLGGLVFIVIYYVILWFAKILGVRT